MILGVRRHNSLVGIRGRQRSGLLADGAHRPPPRRRRRRRSGLVPEEALA